MAHSSSPPAASPLPDTATNAPTADADSFPIVGIGSSAGGLEPTQQLLRALPPDLGMAFVVIQHLSPTYESMLADILSRSTTMPVVEVHDEPAVEPNHVYVIPPNRSISLLGAAVPLPKQFTAMPSSPPPPSPKARW